MESKDIVGHRAQFVMTSDAVMTDAVILVNKLGRILDIVDYSHDLKIEIIDYEDRMILPGLIDTHTHGAKSFDTMDAKHESLNEMSKYFASRGVVAFTPTTVTAPDDKTLAAIEQVKASMECGVEGAEILGTYLEGPFLGYENRGAHPASLLQSIDVTKIQSWIEKSGNTIVAVAIDPESENSELLAAHLKAQGINTMLAHTSADYDCTKRLLDSNATGIVHCFNGMTGLHHRNPGVVGAGLTHPTAFVEIIVDGHHVHGAAVDVAYRCCGRDRLVLVTDSMCAAGMEDGNYKLGELDVTVTNGVCRTQEGGLAGSTLNLDDAVMNLANMIDSQFVDVWKNASSIPAKMLNLQNDLGSLGANKKASFVVVNCANKLSIHATIVNGKKVFKQGEG